MVPSSFNGYPGLQVPRAALSSGCCSWPSPYGRSPCSAITHRRPGSPAGSAFTALVNAFSVSLLALVPTVNLVYGAVVPALVSLYNTIKLNRNLGRGEVQLFVLLFSFAAFAGEMFPKAASEGRETTTLNWPEMRRPHRRRGPDLAARRPRPPAPRP